MSRAKELLDLIETSSYVLWGTKKGKKDWEEQVIIDTSDEKKLKDAIAWAKKNNFDRLRVSGLDMKTPPDFIGALNLKRGK